VVQRVREASVSVGGEVVTSGQGLIVLLGVAVGDGEREADRLASKVARLRIFENAEGRFDVSLLDVGGEALVDPRYFGLPLNPPALLHQQATRERRFAGAESRLDWRAVNRAPSLRVRPVAGAWPALVVAEEPKDDMGRGVRIGRVCSAGREEPVRRVRVTSTTFVGFVGRWSHAQPVPRRRGGSSAPIVTAARRR
jgi:hypothetical protein